MKEEHIGSVKKLLETPRNIVVVTHKNPDGDAIGASLAMYHYLKQQDHRVSVITPNDYPDFLKWMPAQEVIFTFESSPQETSQKIKEADIIFTLDFNALSRVDGMKPLLESTSVVFIMIDHHQEPEKYATYAYTDTRMSSTCEMVYNFIAFMGDIEKINTDVATCLYTGILTDTGSFRFPSTTSQTHRVVADLIDKGAANARIYDAVFDTISPGKLQLLGYALKNITLLPELQAAYMVLLREDLKQYNYRKGDTEGFVNYGLSIKGITCCAIFIQAPQENHIRVSIRSKGSFPVNELAKQYFEGGGHLNAAGGKSDVSIEETIEIFKNGLILYKNQFKKT